MPYHDWAFSNTSPSFTDSPNRTQHCWKTHIPVVVGSSPSGRGERSGVGSPREPAAERRGSVRGRGTATRGDRRTLENTESAVKLVFLLHRALVYTTLAQSSVGMVLGKEKRPRFTAQPLTASSVSFSRFSKVSSISMEGPGNGSGG
jgi:hypothetical protein